MSGVLDRDIRVRLQYLTEGQDIVKADMKELVGIVGQLTTATNGLLAAQQRQHDHFAGNTGRELGLLEQLQARYRELQTAIERAASVEDIRLLNRELDKVQAEMTAIASAGKGWEASMRSANAAGKDVRGTMGGLQGDLASVRGLILQAFGAYEILQFGKGVIEARSHMESFDVSLRTMLQNKGQADELSAKLVQYAQRTPFELKDLQELTSKLLAFGFGVDEIIPSLDILGNMAAGVGREKLPMIALAYGQVRTAQRLTGEELRQFVENGVPLIDALAKTTGKSAADIASKTAEMGISFGDVQKALQSLTGVGGMFYNLQIEKSTSLEGILSNLNDKWYQAKARIGEYVQGGIKQAVSWSDQLIDKLFGTGSAIEQNSNYVKAGITAWITYRASLSAGTVALAAKELVMKAVTLATGTYNLALLTLRGTTEGMTRAQLESAVAARALGTAFAANPIGAVVAVLGLAVTAFYAFRDVTKEATEGLDDTGKKAAEANLRLNGLVGAITSSNTGYETRARLIAQLRREHPEFLAGIQAENVTNETLLQLLAKVNVQYGERIKLSRLAFAAEQNKDKQIALLKEENEILGELQKKFPEYTKGAVTAAQAVEMIKNAAKGLSKETKGWFDLDQSAQVTSSLARYEIQLGSVGRKQKELFEQESSIVAQTEKTRAEADMAAEKRYKADVKREADLLKIRSGRAGQETVYTAQMEEEYQRLVASTTAYEKAHAKTTNTIVTGTEKRKAAAKSSLEIQLESEIKTLESEQRTYETSIRLIEAKAEREAEVAKREYKDKKITAQQLADELKEIEKRKENEIGKYKIDYWSKVAKEVGEMLVKNEKDERKERKETAEFTQKLQKEIEDAEKDIHKEQMERSKIEYEAKQRNFALVLDMLSKESQLVGDIGRAAKTLWDTMDGLSSKRREELEGKLGGATSVLVDLQMRDDGSKGWEARIAEARKSVEVLKTDIVAFEAESDAAMLSVVNMAVTTSIAVARAYAQMMAQSYQAVADAYGNAREAVGEFYDFVIQQSAEALDLELQTFQGSYDEKRALIEGFFDRQRELYEMKGVAEIYLGSMEDFNRIDAERMKSATNLMEVVFQGYANQIRREEELRLNDARRRTEQAVMLAQLEIDEAGRVRDARVEAIDAAFRAFKEATDAEMDLAKQAAEEKKKLTEQAKADETEAIGILDRLRNEALERYRRDEVARLEATRDRILATLTDEDEKTQVINYYAEQIAAKHQEVEDAKLDKSKGVSLATKQLKEEEKTEIARIETELKDKISQLQDQIKAQEIRAAQEKASANNDYKNAVYGAQREIFELNRQMKIAELRAEIAIVKAKRNMWNGARIRQAVDDLNGAIGFLQGMSFGAPSGDFSPPEGGVSDVLPPNTNTGGTDTQIFHDGTENVRRSSRTGGFVAYDEVPAILQVGERVVTTEQNRRLSGISNEQLVRMVEAYRGGSSVHYKPIDLSGFGPVQQATDLKPMLTEIQALRAALKEQPQYNITNDERGVTIAQRKSAAKITYRNNRFRK